MHSTTPPEKQLDTEQTKNPALISYDALIRPHIVTQKLKYDDIEALESTRKLLASETGMDRWEQVFHVSETGAHSQEYENMLMSLSTVLIAGFLLGSGTCLRNFRKDYVYYNKLSKYEAKIKAVRQMNDQVWVRSAIEGMKWATRLTVFTGCFLGVSQAISIYRNKSSVLDYVAGAAFTGSVLKVNLGLKGMVGGGVVAGSLGLVAGVMIYGLQWTFDETQERRHFKNVYQQQLDRLRIQRLKTQKSPEV